MKMSPGDHETQEMTAKFRFRDRSYKEIENSNFTNVINQRCAKDV